MGSGRQRHGHADPNATLTSDFIFSSVKTVASDVEVVLADKSGLVESLDLSLTWGLFDISGGDAESTSPTENDLSDLFVKGTLDYALEAMGGDADSDTTVTVDQVDGHEDTTTIGLELRGSDGRYSGYDVRPEVEDGPTHRFRY